MKHLLLAAGVMLLATSCDWFVEDKPSSDSIGGTTSIPINTVGNTFSNAIRIGSTGQAASGSISITSVDANGVATVKFTGTIPSNVPILTQIKSKYKDSSGKLSCEGKFKMTDKGILDYNNKDHKPFVLVNYDGEVGDKYTLEKSDGTKIVREVVRKSKEDDFMWGAMMIKTTDVEQSSNISGVQKIKYFTNHKFGLVAVWVYMEDGTVSRMDLTPSKY